MKFTEYELGELGDIITGKTPKKSNNTYYNSNEVIFIKPDDMTVNNIKYISTANEFVSSQGAATGRVVGKGTVLVTCIGIIGKIGIVDTDEAIFNQQINAIIPNEKLILGKYLAYVLHSMQKMLQEKANAPIVPIINKSDFSKIKVLVPDIDYQKRVISVLDKSQALIHKRQSQIAALYELTQSVFLKKFRNEMKRNMVELGNVLESLKYGTSEKSTKEGYPVLRIPNIKNGVIDETDLKFCDLEGKAYESFRLEMGDLLFVRSNGNQSYVGRCATVSVNQEGYVYASYLIRAKVKSTIAKPEFISYYLNAPFGRKDVLKKSRTSAGQYNINTKGLSELRIPLPTIDKQNEFVDFLVSIQNKSDNLKVSLNLMEELYNSLLQKAFKGELFQNKI